MKTISILFFISVFSSPIQEDELETEIVELWKKFQSSSSKAEYKGAEQTLDKILEKKKDLAAAFYYRGRIRFQMGKIKGSIADFDQYIKLIPDM